MGELTAVVLTPHSSNFSKVGAETCGVSINSKSLSEQLASGLDAIIAFPCLVNPKLSVVHRGKGHGTVLGGKYMGSWTAWGVFEGGANEKIGGEYTGEWYLSGQGLELNRV